MSLPSGFRLYLASRSPRRRELLRQIGVGFELLPLREQNGRAADVDESPLPGESPDDYVRRVTLLKANAGWERLQQRKLPSLPVLSADTTVCIDGEILGKPEDEGHAARMLARLSGREHRVLTAVALQSRGRRLLEVSDSLVRFRAISDDEIAAYVATGESMGKAGAYGIQGLAGAFVPELRGSYTGVMGLPLFETAELIRRVGRGER